MSLQENHHAALHDTMRRQKARTLAKLLGPAAAGVSTGARAGAGSGGGEDRVGELEVRLHHFGSGGQGEG